MRNKTAYIGIDPGAKGAFCLLLPHKDSATFFATTNPAHKIYETLLKVSASYQLRQIMMEQVSSIPGAAAGSNFKFGHNVGMLKGIVECTALGYDFVRPKAWQKEIGVPAKAKGKDIKVAVADIAKRLYPTAELHGPKGGLLDGRSDALMIAHYAMLKYQNK